MLVKKHFTLSEHDLFLLKCSFYVSLNFEVLLSLRFDYGSNDMVVILKIV